MSDGVLSKIYYDPKHPASFSSVNNLYKAVNKQIPLNKIRDFLSAQRVYTLHRRPRKKFQRDRILVYRKNELFEMDLADLTDRVAKDNDGFRYIFMCIDVLSKFLYATPIKNKKPETIITVLNDLFKKVKPRFIRSDYGGEFSSHRVQTFIKDQGVHQYFTRNETTKAAVVERVIQTIKSRLYKYFSYTGTYKYLHVLDDIISAYNNSYHSSIKTSPASVITFQDEMKAYFNLFPLGLKQFIKPKIQVGDTVRLAKHPTPFTKSYHPQYTEELFTVGSKISNSRFKVKDSSNSEIIGSFYNPELQKVPPPTNETLYKVEQILKTRKKHGRIEYFVKWLGYPTSANSWTREIVS